MLMKKSTRVFGVIGQLNKEEYAHKWRAGCNGKYIPLDREDIFDLSNTTHQSIHESELEKVKERRFGGYARPAVKNVSSYRKPTGSKNHQDWDDIYKSYMDFYESSMDFDWKDYASTGKPGSDIYSTPHGTNDNDHLYLMRDSETFIKSFTEMLSSHFSGMDITTELSDNVRAYVDLLCSIEDFGGEQIEAMFDQLTVGCEMEDLNVAASTYFEIEWEEVDADEEEM